MAASPLASSIDPPASDLADAIASAARLAALAPSSHNSQPWALGVASAGPLRARIARHLDAEGGAAIAADAPLLVLALDRARALRSLDAHALEMDLSCGAYLHVLLAALATSGWEACAVHVDETGALGRALTRPWPIPWQPRAVVALRRSGGSSPARHAALTRALHARVTNRAPYAPRPLPDRAGAVLATAARSLAAPTTFAPRLVADRATIDAAAALVRRFAPRDFAHATAWRETYAFIHWSDAAARRAEVGFPITQLLGAMPAWKQRLVQAALSPIAMALLKRLGFARFLGGSLARLVAQSPALVALELPEGDASLAGRLAAGGAMIDLWLRATELGLALHPVSVVLQHDDARAEVERAIGARGRVFFFARAGRPTVDFPRAPRRRDPDRDVVLL